MPHNLRKPKAPRGSGLKQALEDAVERLREGMEVLGSGLRRQAPQPVPIPVPTRGLRKR